MNILLMAAVIKINVCEGISQKCKVCWNVGGWCLDFLVTTVQQVFDEIFCALKTFQVLKSSLLLLLTLIDVLPRACCK